MVQNAFLEPFGHRSFCQDRLGTSRGEVEGKGAAERKGALQRTFQKNSRALREHVRGSRSIDGIFNLFAPLAELSVAGLLKFNIM